MAADVRLPVRLVCEPWRGRQTSPVRAVGVGGAIAEDFQRVAPVGRVVRAVGQPLQFEGPDLGTVLRPLQVAQFRFHPVQGAVQPLLLRMEAIDQSPDQAFALVGKHGPVRAQAFGGKVDDLAHDAGQVRVLERGAQVGKVQRVAGVQVGVLIAADLVFLAPGAPLGEGQRAEGTGLDAVGGFPQGPVVELVRAGGRTVQGGGFAGHGGCRCRVFRLVLAAGLPEQVGSLDHGGVRAPGFDAG